MVQVVEHLPNKNEALSSNPCICKKKEGKKELKNRRMIKRKGGKEERENKVGEKGVKWKEGETGTRRKRMSEQNK
jgi:hypothetical protein